MRRFPLDSLARRARLAFALLFAVIPITAGCQRQLVRPLTPEQQATWTRDSIRYLSDAAKWVSDSVVRDSISRTINTDTLFRTYHRILSASDPAPVFRELQCVYGELSWTYGLIPAEYAISRMMGTVWRRDDSTVVRRALQTIQNMGPEQTAQTLAKHCRADRGPQQPRFVNGVALLAMGGRPPRPVHP